jgi:hypothetical protein
MFLMYEHSLHAVIFGVISSFNFSGVARANESLASLQIMEKLSARVPWPEEEGDVGRGA